MNEDLKSRLTSLMALAEKATPGTWKGFDGANSLVICQEENLIADGIRPCDSAYIAAANPEAIIGLIQQMKAMLAFQDALCSALDIGQDYPEGLVRMEILNRTIEATNSGYDSDDTPLVDKLKAKVDLLEKECSWLANALSAFVRPVDPKSCRDYAKNAAGEKNE